MKKILPLLICLLLFFYSAFFLRMPFERIFFQVRFIITIFLSFFTIFFAIYFRKKFNIYLLYFLFLMFVPGLYSAWMADSFFGQSLFYGILAERRWLTIGFSFFLYFLLVKKVIDFNSLKNSFVCFAFFSLFLFVLFFFFALTFPDVSVLLNGIVKFSKLKGLRVKINYFFLLFGAIYFFINYHIRKEKVYLLALLVFMFALLFFYKGRMVFILFVVVCVVFLFEYFRKKAFWLVANFFFMILLLLGVMSAINYNFVRETIFPYKLMIKTLKGKRTRDASINSRKKEIFKVITFWVKSPKNVFLGVGRLSKKCRKAHKNFFGRLFPLDIGFLGVIFVYGIFGWLLVFVIPFFIAFRFFVATNKIGKGNAFLLSLNYLMLFYLLQGFFSAKMVFTPYVIMLPLFIIFAFFELNNVSIDTWERGFLFRDDSNE